MTNSQAPQPAPEALAAAWAEGYRLGVLDERTSADSIGIAGFDAKVEPARQNPYGLPAPGARRQAEPVAVLETPEGVIDLRAIAEQAGISMDCWDMGAASLAYSDGVQGITREHLEKFASLYGFACWNAALEANPPNLNGFISRAIADAMSKARTA